ncbi:WD40 repeat-like protein [Punctularia strigosozonata HHB-11173 SS5]|uniref:WD40 repeat-like protein n=1 Tax=Punctularia strigosozonata (strain HHB-11173) TaxID=741275 RepID=UPI0004416678|nr:WD40 repeat-like protein [Punctularia strigosozonata HHB-11173 SS5]EIN07189.1 WD40 repeat-like protein [Punctularia strigosozonata HHB-11173 SS5]
MRLSERDDESLLSISPSMANDAFAGPSTPSTSANPGTSNGHSNGHTNGASTSGLKEGFSVRKSGKSVTRVSLPGKTLYDDSLVDREEFVRLVIQSLREVGYIESAATLEAESGYEMELPQVSDFRRYILDGLWGEAEDALLQLGVADHDALYEARFLISRQKYLELLEEDDTTAALHVLRTEITPLNIDTETLHFLSSLLMCADTADLRQRVNWDDSPGSSRRRLLSELQRFIPSSIMIPPRRFSTLLTQALTYQRQSCIYHNGPTPLPIPGSGSSLTSSSSAFSLYRDHLCDKNAFPRITTMILEGHTDEVWNLKWSHDGQFLATVSKDQTAIIWKVGPEEDAATRECSQVFVLRDHEYEVGCLAWSIDDKVLLTGADHVITRWNAQTGACMGKLPSAHHETVTALVWLPDGSGFISGALDRKIILWDADGKQRDNWGTTAIRVTDLAVTPDLTRVVAVGMYHVPTVPNPGPHNGADSGTGAAAGTPGVSQRETRMIVYDLATKQPEASIRLEGELTSVSISQDSRYALVNHTPDEIHLWDLNTARLVRKLTGQRQGNHVIRSCFGGVDGNFVASGSEDANVYIWHRDSGALLEVLSGHGRGSVNAVAWNPRNARMFASCSDDATVRIWESEPGGTFSSDIARISEPDSKGKGKTRERWDATGGRAHTSGLTL